MFNFSHGQISWTLGSTWESSKSKVAFLKNFWSKQNIFLKSKGFHQFFYENKACSNLFKAIVHVPILLIKTKAFSYLFQRNISYLPILSANIEFHRLKIFPKLVWLAPKSKLTNISFFLLPNPHVLLSATNHFPDIRNIWMPTDPPNWKA